MNQNEQQTPARVQPDNNTQQPPSPPQDVTKITEPPSKRRKLNFKRLLPIIITTVIMGGMVAITLVIVPKIKLKLLRPTKPSDESLESTASTAATQPKDPFETYTDETYGFSFTYPSDLTLEQLGIFSNESLQYRIIYKGQNQADTPKTEEDLTDGYVFKVYVHKNLTAPLIGIVEQKKAKYELDCAETVKASEVTQTTVDTHSAYTFEVVNCPPDYKETFLTKGNAVLEIVQIHRGDLGFRQQYKIQTEEILKTFKLTSDDTESKETFTTYKSDAYKFSFKYKDLNPNCCNMAGPMSENVKKLVVLADKEPDLKTFDGAFDGVGVFVDENPEDVSFDLYINTQKQRLIQEYKVIMEKNPTTQEEAIQVGNVTGVLLEGYAWWGDIIYVPLPNKSEFLIIAKTEVSSDGLGETFTNILNSFKFY